MTHPPHNTPLQFILPIEPARSAKVLKFEDMPPFCPEWHHPLMAITSYLSKLIGDIHQTEFKTCVFLPSLSSLKDLFGTTDRQVQEALRELKLKGYDNFVPGLYGPITLWNKTTDLDNIAVESA